MGYLVFNFSIDYWNDRIEAASKGLLESWKSELSTHKEHRERSFKFLELPAEIRNQIYNFIFQPKIFEIYWLTHGRDLIHRKHSSVESLPSTKFDDQRNHHRDMIRKKSPNITFQRRRWDLPTRLKYKNPITPPFEIPSGPAALLLTCTQIRAETTPIFYRTHEFHFTSRAIFKEFLCFLSQESKAFIRTLHIYYKPQLLDPNDTEEWEGICRQAAKELTALEELNLTMCLPWHPIPEMPAPPEQLDSEKHWAKPWLAFRGRGLKRVRISSNLKDPFAEPVKRLRDLLVGLKSEQAIPLLNQLIETLEV